MRLLVLSLKALKQYRFKKVPHKVCEKFDGAKEFNKETIEEICCQEKLSVEKVPYFVYERLHFIVSF